MCPRPAASRHDASAAILLGAAAQLIDASLSPDGSTRSPRLGSLHYPAALDWIRIEDVLRLARETGRSVSKRALLNRWPTKDEFIRDAVIHALLYRDEIDGEPIGEVPTLEQLRKADSFTSGVASAADNLVEVLIAHPRSFLLAHIAPLLPRHPALAADIRARAESSLKAWSDTYLELLDYLQLGLRSDWPVERLSMAIQVVLDGIVIRSRIEPDRVLPSRWARASLYADTVLAILCGALDVERDSLSMRDWMDQRVGSATSTIRYA